MPVGPQGTSLRPFHGVPCHSVTGSGLGVMGVNHLFGFTPIFLFSVFSPLEKQCRVHEGNWKIQ